jgi:hypothetical protein
MPEASMDFVRSVTFTVAIRAAPQHTRTDGVTARFQFSMPKSEDALVVKPEATSIQGTPTPALMPTPSATAAVALTPALTPMSPSGAPADRADNGAVIDDPNDGKPEEAAACADGRAFTALTPELEAYVQSRVDAAVEHAVEHDVEEAVTRAMESFCEWDLGGHIQEQLRSENAEDRGAFEQLEARVDELEDSCNRVDSDDFDEVKRDVEALSIKVDALRALTETLDALNATCDALARRVTELELSVTSRTRQAMPTTRAKSRKRAV